MREIANNILFFIGLLTLISACNNAPENKSPEVNEFENSFQQIFLIGEGPVSKETIIDLIDKAGIKAGGYVAILSMSLNGNDTKANLLQQKFYEQNIGAVHTFDFYSDSTLRATDCLAIENATILCLLGEHCNKFMQLANNSLLKSMIFQAYDKGTLIAGIGKGASILGDYYYHQVRDSISGEVKLIEKSGLGLLKHTVIEDITLFRNYKNGIERESTKRNMVFIGLDNQACLWLKNGDALVLRESEIGLVSPGESAIVLNKDDEFRLISK